MRASFIILLSLILQPCALLAGESIAKIGGWNITKTTDSMTDKTSCAASFTKHPNVYMTAEKILISMHGKGGIEASQYRFDKEPASELALPFNGVGRQFWAFDIDRALEAERLQVQIKPIIGSIVTFDIDLRRARDIHQLLVSDRCK